jgi:hypothetical protein
MQPLETRPVNLVAGLLGSEASVGAFGGFAVIDDTVDFASDGHGKAVLLGELNDDAGSLDALGDLIHRRDLADATGAGGPERDTFTLLTDQNRHCRGY